MVYPPGYTLLLTVSVIRDFKAGDQPEREIMCSWIRWNTFNWTQLKKHWFLTIWIMPAFNIFHIVEKSEVVGDKLIKWPAGVDNL